MRAKMLLLTVLLGAQMALAKDYVIVIRKPDLSIGHTEVTDEPGVLHDTLSVVPSNEATTIYVTLRNANGNVLQQDCLSALREDYINIISPSLPNGYFLEVRDDRGFIYEEYKY